MKTFRSGGFTLLELMVVVALIAILTGLAYASYSDAVRKAARGDAQAALVGFASAMQRHYTESTPSSYKGAGPSGGDTGAPTIYPTKSPLDGQNKQYNLTIQSASATAYELRAAPISGSAAAADKCGTLTLTSTGVRGITGGDTGVTWDDCWR